MRSFDEIFKEAHANYKFLEPLRDSRPAAFLVAKELVIILCAFHDLAENDGEDLEWYLKRSKCHIEEFY